MNPNFIVAPTKSLAMIMERELGREFKFERRPSHVIYDRNGFSLEQLQGLERANFFVPVSPREFLSVKDWPGFIKHVRQQYVARCMRGPQSMHSKWIEVYLP